MNNLICIPPCRDVDRAVALVPQKYVDEMFILAEMELKSTLDVSVRGGAVFNGSPATCKWFNSEMYLYTFCQGLRERTDQVFVDLLTGELGHLSGSLCELAFWDAE